MNFGEKLEFLMAEEKITRAELSRETGVAYTTLDSMLKRNEFEKLKLPVVQAIAKYFDVSLDYLMRDEITDSKYGKKLAVDSLFPTEGDFEFYKVLQKIMEERSMSIPDVARATGLSDSTVRSIITRKSKGVALEVAAKISNGLGIDLEELNGDFPLTKTKSTDTYISLSTDELAELESLNPLTGKKLTSREKKQYTEFMEKAAQALFFDDEISERDKETIYRNITDVFWNAKEKNRRKKQPSE